MAASSMYSGDSVSIAVTVTDSTTGAAVNITGATMTWALATAPGTTPLLTKTSGDGDITVSGASSNVATVALAPADTAALNGVYHHELQIVDGGGNKYTVYQGSIYILADMVTT
jgi:hypothetical protein